MRYLILALLFGCPAEPVTPVNAVESNEELCRRYCEILDKCEPQLNCWDGCIEVLSDPEQEQTTEFRKSLETAICPS